MINPVIGVLAVTKAGTLAWWVTHLARTKSVSAANRAVADDWDTLTGYGNEVAAFAKTIYGLNALEAKDFNSFSKTVCDCRKMLTRFPNSTKPFLESNFQVTRVLEEESRIAYTHYAASLANDDTGSPRKRINNMYHALHILGRTDWPIPNNVRDGLYIRLMQGHQKCIGKTHDHKIHSVLERLQSATVGEFKTALTGYLGKHAKQLKLSPVYIAHALMPLSQGKLNHGGIAEEISKIN